MAGLKYARTGGEARIAPGCSCAFERTQETENFRAAAAGVQQRVERIGQRVDCQTVETLECDVAQCRRQLTREKELRFHRAAGVHEQIYSCILFKFKEFYDQ